MKKKILSFVTINLILILLTGCDFKIKSKNYDSDKEINEVIFTINDIDYNVNLENNETTDLLIQLLPLKLTMSDLNDNEKYVYLKESLPTDSYKPKKINAGDIMLYGDNCLVIFYKSFESSYSYTKIGHIDNLPNFNQEDIIVSISKSENKNTSK